MIRYNSHVFMFDIEMRKLKGWNCSGILTFCNRNHTTFSSEGLGFIWNRVKSRITLFLMIHLLQLTEEK